LHHRPFSQEERDQLTPHELFVLVLARRLDRLTDAEQQRLTSADRQYLASAGLLSSKSVTDIKAAGHELRSAATASQRPDPASKVLLFVNSPATSSIPPRI
jgi:hypothetical protein